MDIQSKYKRLVVNGCSYMHYYSEGGGLQDLAQSLSIEHTKNLSLTGASNQRIIRTTLDDCYSNDIPTIYIIGVTFVNRFELPILEGLERNFNHDNYKDRFLSINQEWTIPEGTKINEMLSMDDILQFRKLKTMFEMDAEVDIVVNLIQSYTSMIDSLIRHGNTVILFNTAEIAFKKYQHLNKLQYTRNYKQIIDYFNWFANEYQFNKGAKPLEEDLKKDFPDPMIRHIDYGEHKYINEFLIRYGLNNNLF